MFYDIGGGSFKSESGVIHEFDWFPQENTTEPDALRLVDALSIIPTLCFPFSRSEHTKTEPAAIQDRSLGRTVSVCQAQHLRKTLSRVMKCMIIGKKKLLSDVFHLILFCEVQFNGTKNDLQSRWNSEKTR